MGQTRAMFCDEETCNRLAPFGYTGHWLEVRDLDVDFCSVTCALDYTVGLWAKPPPEDCALINAVVDARAAINPEARAEAARWREEHESEKPHDD